MQFTTGLVSFLLAAATTGVQALPSSPVEQRQEARRIFASFWADTACGDAGGRLVEDTVWLQDAQPLGTCLDVNVWDPTFNSTRVSFNNADHTLRVYSQNNCLETGPNANYFDVRPEELNCWAQRVESVKFLA